MTDIYSSKGWRNRLRASASRDAEQNDAERLEIRRERQKIYDAQAAADAAAVEAQRVALAAARCSCPACGGSGTVEVPKAAAMIEAWHNYNFHDYKPSQGMIAAIAAIARGEPTPAGAPNVVATYGFVLPFPGQLPAPVAVETVEPPKPVKTAKAQKPVEDESLFLADGALVEV